ncbi:hypothetical protein AB0I60_34710 [Actinosynnema sp. NPDC050436]|uniref:hypothetical protein n=1 Tax=Actinosynnema sp. NPDC050436 TaxID=3155659 RepID=UPI00340C90FD
MARTLVRTGRVAVFLDGLDEMPEGFRTAALAALDDAPFRLVLLSRTEEIVAASREAPLRGALALELQPLRSSDATSYLLSRLVDPPPPAWRTLIDALRPVDNPIPAPSGVLADALSTPLSVTLILEIYNQGDPVDELLDTNRFPNARTIGEHLLDHAVGAAYTPRPGREPPPCSVATAERTLRLLAARMGREGTRDLPWWHLATWMNTGGAFLAVLTIPAMAGVTGALMVDIRATPAAWLFTAAFACITVRSLLVSPPSAPKTPAGLRPLAPRRNLWRTRLSMLTVSAGWGAAASLPFLLSDIASGRPVGGLVVWGFGVGVGAAVGVFRGSAAVFIDRRRLDTGVLGPKQAWRHERNFAVAVMALGCPFFSLALIPGFDWEVGLASGFMAVVGTVVCTGRGQGFALFALTSLFLTITRRTPLRLLRFLEDARSRHLLRAVGPIYQFRHATLRDRLAAFHSETAVDHPRRRSRRPFADPPVRSVATIAFWRTLVRRAKSTIWVGPADTHSQQEPDDWRTGQDRDGPLMPPPDHHTGHTSSSGRDRPTPRPE